MLKKINYKMLIFYILFALLFGGIGAILGGNFSDLAEINKPAFAPPAILFPIVWSILYILMGVSSYLVCESYESDDDKKSAGIIYIIQLIVNALWTLFFFRLKWYLFSFIWIILLIVLVIIMIIKFYNINKVAGYLQIPYLLWISFASILNFAIYLLN